MKHMLTCVFVHFHVWLTMMITFMKKSHTEQASNAKITKNCYKNQILRYFLPLGAAVFCYTLPELADSPSCSLTFWSYFLPLR